MLTKGFMSEVQKYKRMHIGTTENIFLGLIVRGPTSTYDIFKNMSNTGFKEDKIAYKNVHETVHNLLSKGLIERVEGKFARNAIKYKLTSQGFLEYLNRGVIFPPVLKNYEQNPILQTILYQFFEPNTIHHFFTYLSMFTLQSYIKDCCRTIFEQYENFSKSHAKMNAKDLDYLELPLYSTVRSKVEKFIFEIVTHSDIKTEDLKMVVTIMDNDGVPKVITDVKGSGHGDPNFEYVYPVNLLKKDKKFIETLKGVKEAFDHNYKIFIKD